MNKIPPTIKQPQDNNKNQIKISQSDIDLPLELILSVNKSNKEDDYVSRSIINFFNLSLTSEQQRSNKSISQLDLFKAKKLIDYLNFIRFNNSITTTTTTTNQNENQSSINKITNRINVPNYSIVLLTNSPNQKIIINQNELNDEKNSNNWSYHHKIELNDENGQTIARQVFYKLNPLVTINNSPNGNTNLKHLPLCCRSNWISPISNQNQSAAAAFSKKYITRLNINCKNYDLMLFFYRLLFDKFPNFSKKDFSLFILVQNSHKIKTDTHIEQITVEFQLSLKYDPNVSVNKISNSSLLYKISDRATFDNVIRLLDGFVEEIEKNKIYSVLDPDHNKIYLIDVSNRSSPTPKVFSSTGVADNYYTQLNSILKFSQDLPNNFSPNSNTSSSSETNSFDSGKDSGNWSCSTLSVTNYKPSLSKKFNYKQLHNLNNHQDVKITNNNNTDNNNFLNNIYNSNKYQFLNSSENNFGVRSLIKKFTNSPDSPNSNHLNSNSFNNLVYNRPGSSMSSRIHSQRKPRRRMFHKNLYSDEESEDYDEDSDDEDRDDRELRNLLKKASNNSMYALNALAYRNKSLKNRASSQRSFLADQRFNQRSLSALNEPYNNKSINQNKLKGVLSTNNSTLNRKKSKSVTFMDSIGSDNHSNSNRSFLINNLKDNQYNQYGYQRSKSTTPFIRNTQSPMYHDDIDNFNMTANNDDYYLNTCNNNNNNFLNQMPRANFNQFNLKNFEQNYYNFNSSFDRQKLGNFYEKPMYKNSLIDHKNDSAQIMDHEFFNKYFKKPNVGITAETRFRRAHTLDMIRSTKMPLDRNQQKQALEQHLEQQGFYQKNYLNSSNRYNLPVAKF